VPPRTVPDIIAHRGESHDAPENTIAAFRLAWERGIRTVELDVRLTSDMRLVVCHDADTMRTTGVRHVVAETPLAVLQSLDAGAWKGPGWAGERTPTLEEALAVVPDDGCVWIEIKSGPDAAGPVAEAIRRAGLAPDRVNVISFGDDVLRASADAIPEVPTQLISGFGRRSSDGPLEPSMADLIARALSAGAAGINVHWDGPINEETVAETRRAGLRLGVWTVDDAGTAERMTTSGVDAITSNRAAWLRAGLASIRARSD